MSFFSINFTVSRSIIINSSQQDVFETVQNLNTWNIWSPWMLQDPEADQSIAGDGKSIGSIMSWDGELIGAGELEHVAFEKNNSLVQEIRFTRPFSSVSKVIWNFESAGKDKTKVTWKMDSSIPFFLFFMKNMMKAMIGEDYDRGLKMLKSYVETGKIESYQEMKGIISSEKVHYVGVRKKESITEMQKNMEGIFSDLWDGIEKKNIEVIGTPFSIYHKMDFVNQVADYTCAFPVKEKDCFAEDGIIFGVREAQKAFSVYHKGEYIFLGNAWAMAMNYAITKKILKKKDAPWEEYISNPSDTAEKELETMIFVPVK